MENTSNSLVKDTRRNNILLAALPLFTIQGYDAVKIDDITKACGCSHGLFYHYFPSKLECFNTMIDEAFASGRINYPTEWFQGEKPIEKMQSFVSQVHKLLKDDEINCCYFYIFLTNPFQRTLPLKKCSSKHSLYYRLKEIIKEGQEEGTFLEGTPHEMTLLFLSFLKGILYERLHNEVIPFQCPRKKVMLRLLIKSDALNKNDER